jgi:hypothetical protein
MTWQKIQDKKNDDNNEANLARMTQASLDIEFVLDSKDPDEVCFIGETRQ